MKIQNPTPDISVTLTFFKNTFFYTNLQNFFQKYISLVFLIYLDFILFEGRFALRINLISDFISDLHITNAPKVDMHILAGNGTPVEPCVIGPKVLRSDASFCEIKAPNATPTTAH